MDYGELLYKAQQNERNAGKQDTSRCYKAGFAPPKKLERTVSSANVKKFLAKKENEEKLKMEEAKKKKEELLALRNQDKKAKRRVEVMLKRTKSANYSVMEDAIDNNNTAVTLEGPMQCDEDDYGYVSQEASAFYAKIMNKYNSMPAEPSPFSKTKKEVKDLSAAKDRVRAALRKEEDEAELPHKRKRKHKDSEGDEKEEDEKEDSKDKSKSKSSEKSAEEKPVKKKVNTAPPPPSFEQLLKLAEEKKSQPVDIEKLIRDRPKEPDRPMTQKEKIEWQREQERKINRDRRERGLAPIPSQYDDKGKPKSDKPAKFRIPKNGSSESSSKPPEKETRKENKPEPKPSESYKKLNEKPEPKSSDSYKKLNGDSSRKVEPSRSSTNDKPKSSLSSKRPEERSRPVEKKISFKEETPTSMADLDDIDREIELLKRKRMLLEKSKMQAQVQVQSKPSEKPKAPSISSKSAPAKVPEKSRSSESTKPKPSSASVSSKPKEQPPKGPPKLAGAKDVARPSYLPPTKPKNKPVQKPKRRIDSESEYDSELDDFIDDGDEEIDYSSCIKEIFGYDKSRYAGADDDDECMESNFAQISKEEFVSTKIGIMEDLEDIRKEQEEKKRMKMKKVMKMKSARGK